VEKLKTLEELAEEYLVLYRRILEEEAREPGSVRYEVLKAAAVYSDRKLLLEKLRELARGYGGCVSCAYSKPCENWPFPECRWCELGLAQDTCGKWTLIE